MNFFVSVREELFAFWEFLLICTSRTKQQAYRERTVREFVEIIAQQLRTYQQMDVAGQIVFTLYSMAVLTQMHNRGQFKWGLIKGRDIGLALQEKDFFEPEYFTKLMFVYPIVEECVQYEAEAGTGLDLRSQASVERIRNHPAIRAWLSYAAETEA